MHSPLSSVSLSSLSGSRVAGTLALIAAGGGAVAAAGVTGYMRLEGLVPGQQHLCAEGLRLWPATATCTADGAIWNALVAAHGILMLFFVALPALLGGFGTLALPRLIGARDVAFPRLAIMAGGVQVVATALAIGALFAPGATVGGGMATGMGVAALYLTGLALLAGAVNAITTFLGPRDPHMRWADIPVFAWSLLAANGVVLMSMPILAAAIVTLSGGTQTGLMWIFGHPAILAIVLPALGLVAHGIGVQTHRPLVGRGVVIGAMMTAATLGFFIWAERLLSGGLTNTLGFVLGAVCIGGPVLVTLGAAFLSLRRMTGQVQMTVWWIISLLALVTFGMVAMLVLWGMGRPVVGIIHQTIGLGVVFTLATAAQMMLSHYRAGGVLAVVQLAGMVSGGALVLIGQIVPSDGGITSVGTLVCVAAGALFVPLILRAMRP